MSILLSKTRCFGKTLCNFIIIVSLTIFEITALHRKSSSYDRQNAPYNRQDHPHNRQNSFYGHQNRQLFRRNPQSPLHDQSYAQENLPYGSYERSNSRPSYDRYNQYNLSQFKRLSQRQYEQKRFGHYDIRLQYDNYDKYHVKNRHQYEENADQYFKDLDKNTDQNGDSNQYRDNYYQGGKRNLYNHQNFYVRPLSRRLLIGNVCCQEYCHIKDKQPYLKFATKTAYQFFFEKNSTHHRIPDCTPVQIWTINRHGTRFPSKKSINKMRQLTKLHAEIIKNYDEKRSYPSRGRLCNEDLDLFKKWKWNKAVNEKNANKLTSQGVMELKFLASRYALRFQELFREPYSDNTYSFQSSSSDRTHASYLAYIDGFLRNNTYQNHPNVLNNDKLLRPSKTCTAWLKQVHQNPESTYESMKFKKKPEYQQMVEDVFKRLGFKDTFNDTILDDMYNLCRYEKAWNLDQPSPWCIVFNKEQLKLLEYAEDLKHYYKAGYGSDINRKVGCPLLKDLYKKFERTVNSNGNTLENKVTAFFTHSTTIQTLSNYNQQNNRQWRRSDIAPFATNLAAVLYECRSNERFRVMFFLNEVLVNYPNCSMGVCNWSAVKNKLGYAAENCNLEFCNRSTTLECNLYSYVICLVSLMASSISTRF